MSNITPYVSPQVQSALKRQWIQYKAQWGQRRREHCSMRSTSYTATSITEVPAFMFHHDCHSEHLNGKQTEDSELVALKTGETYAWQITRRCVFFTASSSWDENNIRMRFFKYVMLKLLVSEAPHIHLGPWTAKVTSRKPKDVLICGTCRVFLGCGSQADGLRCPSANKGKFFCAWILSIQGGYKDLSDGHFVTKYSFVSVSRASRLLYCFRSCTLSPCLCFERGRRGKRRTTWIILAVDLWLEYIKMYSHEKKNNKKYI